MEIRVANKRSESVGQYVGRPSPLGNPYRLGAEYQRRAVITKYREWLRAKIAGKDPRVCGELNRLYSIAKREGSLTLLCWCAPRACHADVIREVLLEKLA